MLLGLCKSVLIKWGVLFQVLYCGGVQNMHMYSLFFFFHHVEAITLRAYYYMSQQLSYD